MLVLGKKIELNLSENFILLSDVKTKYQIYLFKNQTLPFKDDLSSKSLNRFALSIFLI
jgi:hypothetical protein